MIQHFTEFVFHNNSLSRECLINCKKGNQQVLGKSLQHPLQEEGGGGAGEEGPECSHDLDTTWRGWVPEHLPRDGTCVRVRVN